MPGTRNRGRGVAQTHLREAQESTYRDPARSYEPLTEKDLERLGRVADAEIKAFFVRNPHLLGWRSQVRVIALAQGAADHYLRRRGVRDLDVIVCFAENSTLPRLWRRMVVSWDWGPSKLGRCPYDPADYTGRAVDIAFWVIPDRPDPIAAMREWLMNRVMKHPNPNRKPDLAHEPVIVIRPALGFVAWDPPNVPAPRPKAGGHRRPQGLAPP